MKIDTYARMGIASGILAVLLAGCADSDTASNPAPGETANILSDANGRTNEHPLSMVYVGDVNGYRLFRYCDNGVTVYFHDSSYGGSIAATTTQCQEK